VYSGQVAALGGTGPWHPASKLVKSLPMGSPSQGWNTGSNPVGATVPSTTPSATKGAA